jgi:hypothetical protein
MGIQIFAGPFIPCGRLINWLQIAHGMIDSAYNLPLSQVP